MNNFLVGVSVILFIAQPASAFARSSESSKRSEEFAVSVTEKVGGATTVMRRATVSLLVGSALHITASPAEWQNIPVDQEGVARFSGVRHGVVYSVVVWAPGYFPEIKEFQRKGGKPEALSVVLKRGWPDVTGSVRVEVAVQAPQAASPVTTGHIQILMENYLLASSTAKVPTGKEGVIFTHLPIGEGYEAYVTAPGYESQRVRVAIEPHRETPVQLILTPKK